MVWVAIAYLVGTYTGFVLYRRSLMGKVCVAICDIFNEKQSKKNE